MALLAAALAGCSTADAEPALRDQRAAVVQVLQEVSAQLQAPLADHASLVPHACRTADGSTGTRYVLTAAAPLPPGSGPDAVRAVRLLWEESHYLVGEHEAARSTTLLALGTYHHAVSFSVSRGTGTPTARLQVVAGCAVPS